MLFVIERNCDEGSLNEIVHKGKSCKPRTPEECLWRKGEEVQIIEELMMTCVNNVNRERGNLELSLCHSTTMITLEGEVVE